MCILKFQNCGHPVPDTAFSESDTTCCYFELTGCRSSLNKSKTK